MSIDTNIKFFNKKTKNAVLHNGDFYTNELNGSRLPHDIIDNLKNEYTSLVKNDEITKLLNIDVTSYTDYYNPIKINLKTLCEYSSNPYNTTVDNQYSYLGTELMEALTKQGFTNINISDFEAYIIFY